MTTTTTTPSPCRKCGTHLISGKIVGNCCFPGGSWVGTCGWPGEKNVVHTWSQGFDACQNVRGLNLATATTTAAVTTTTAAAVTPTTTAAVTSTTTAAVTPTTTAVVTPTTTAAVTPTTTPVVTTTTTPMVTTTTTPVVTTTSAAVSTPAATVTTATTASSDVAPCPKCGINGKTGKTSCCHRGGSWHKKCGNAGDPNFDHTWTEGLSVCLSAIQAEAEAHPMLSHQRSAALLQSGDFAPGSVVDADAKDSQGFRNLANLTALISAFLVAVHMQM